VGVFDGDELGDFVGISDGDLDGETLYNSWEYSMEIKLENFREFQMEI